ncbi:methionine aminopeptidase, type II [Reticulomyxa filosa]|uniref:Methionine aminopeptidase, type II n=1 Tax=Reticulomyxa filosa TaxID=46433 RepID=X6MQL5_RETFI|nr:methionine aminopeptidase, type II [Reticulomyxa filosa]|eukprot:ETO16298.1 methionine aminopeptidase, type II [Reticulomyxa filosa]
MSPRYEYRAVGENKFSDMAALDLASNNKEAVKNVQAIQTSSPRQNGKSVTAIEIANSKEEEEEEEEKNANRAKTQSVKTKQNNQLPNQSKNTLKKQNETKKTQTKTQNQNQNQSNNNNKNKTQVKSDNGNNLLQPTTSPRRESRDNVRAKKTRSDSISYQFDDEDIRKIEKGEEERKEDSNGGKSITNANGNSIPPPSSSSSSSSSSSGSQVPTTLELDLKASAYQSASLTTVAVSKLDSADSGHLSPTQAIPTSPTKARKVSNVSAFTNAQIMGSFGKEIDLLEDVKLPGYAVAIPRVLIELKKRLNQCDGFQKSFFCLFA